MLTEERYAAILHILEEKKAISVTELAKILDISESTVRRDLNSLHRSGRLSKVHGGATAIGGFHEDSMRQKADQHIPEKIAIAREAANLIEPGDFVYLDAGTTTLHIIDFLEDKEVSYVTNGLPQAKKLASNGFNVVIIGGELKALTEAVVGVQAIKGLSKYNFTKGFFGANGISTKAGYSTPDYNEGLVKSEALLHSKKAYILADSSKFNRISPITFAKLSSATIITDNLPDKKYRDYTTVIEGSENL